VSVVPWLMPSFVPAFSAVKLHLPYMPVHRCAHVVPLVPLVPTVHIPLPAHWCVIPGASPPPVTAVLTVSARPVAPYLQSATGGASSSLACSVHLMTPGARAMYAFGQSLDRQALELINSAVNKHLHSDVLAAAAAVGVRVGGGGAGAVGVGSGPSGGIGKVKGMGATIPGLPGGAGRHSVAKRAGARLPSTRGVRSALVLSEEFDVPSSQTMTMSSAGLGSPPSDGEEDDDIDEDEDEEDDDEDEDEDEPDEEEEEAGEEHDDDDGT
jgi:hypothetical protein